MESEVMDNLKEHMRDMQETLRDHSKDISKLWAANEGNQVQFKAIYDILDKLEKNIERIANAIDKAKWWVITGILGPILLAVIFAALTITIK
jgi:septation ring formation regulator EzrA